MAVTQSLFEDLRAQIGAERVAELGEVSALLIRRYALAIGDSNPLYHDLDYARSRGYCNVVAPPNLVPSLIEWGVGEPEGSLLVDGTAGEHLPGLSVSNVRVMGGGEEMEFYAPVTAGTRITQHATIADVSQRETKSGPMIIATYRNLYYAADGSLLLACRRTVLLR